MARRYELRARAARMEETRRRIVEATASLHEDVGPARTTVAAIAERAGVSRQTVYTQFPDDLSLIAACGARFRDLHPFPSIADTPLEAALTSLYEHYRENRQTLAHVDRDRRIVPALAQVMTPVSRHLDDAASAHAEALDGGTETRTAIRLAFDFSTWDRLDAEGHSPAAAAALMARLVACAG